LLKRPGKKAGKKELVLNLVLLAAATGQSWEPKRKVLEEYGSTFLNCAQSVDNRKESRERVGENQVSKWQFHAGVSSNG